MDSDYFEDRTEIAPIMLGCDDVISEITLFEKIQRFERTNKKYLFELIIYFFIPSKIYRDQILNDLVNDVNKLIRNKFEESCDSIDSIYTVDY